MPVGRTRRPLPSFVPEVQDWATAVPQLPQDSTADQPDNEIRVLQARSLITVVEAVDCHRVISPHSEIAGLNALPIPVSPITPVPILAGNELERPGAFVPKRPAEPHQPPIVARIIQPAPREVFPQPTPLAGHEIPRLRQLPLCGHEVGQDEAVPVHEDNVLSRRPGEREITSPRDAETSVFLAHVVKRIGHVQFKRFDQISCFVCRSVIRDHHFEAIIGLVLEGVQRSRQGSRRIVGREHHRDQH